MSMKHLLVATSVFAISLGTAAFAQSGAGPGSIGSAPYSTGASGSTNGAAAQNNNPGGMNGGDLSHGSGSGSTMNNGTSANGGPMATNAPSATTTHHTTTHHAKKTATRHTTVHHAVAKKTTAHTHHVQQAAMPSNGTPPNATSTQRPGQSMSNAGGRAGAPSGSTLVPSDSNAPAKTNPGPTQPAN
jgi:hypothetical protein